MRDGLKDGAENQALEDQSDGFVADKGWVPWFRYVVILVFLVELKIRHNTFSVKAALDNH